MTIPRTKPTSETWRRDAESLLEMGATMIDAETVRGLIAENDCLEARVTALSSDAEGYEFLSIDEANARAGGGTSFTDSLTKIQKAFALIDTDDAETF